MLFGEESWQSYYPECTLLWQLHYEELGADPKRSPWEPDVDVYRALAAAGRLHITGARQGSKLVGYNVLLLQPNPHYRTVLVAFDDMYYLHPLYRKGLAGVRLVQETVKMLRAKGVRRVLYQSNDKKPMDRLFRYLGFERNYTIWSKWIDEEAG